MKNTGINYHGSSRKRKLICSLVMLLTAFMWLPSVAQENNGSVTFTFLVLKDGMHVSGKILNKSESNIEIMDFVLGKLSISMNQVVKENDLVNGASYCIKIVAGQEYCGMMIRQTDSLVYINTSSIGEIALIPSQIKEVTSTEDRKVVNGQAWFKNPHGTRYLFMPTAIPLKKGEGYFQNSMLLINTVNYGVSDHVSVGAGLAIPFAFMATAKTGYEIRKNIHIGGGAVVAGGFGGLEFGLGAGYGEITFGNEDINCSFATGIGFHKERTYDYSSSTTNSSWVFGKNPMFSASGLARLSNRFAFVTENWFYPERTSHYTGYNSPVTYSTEYKSVNAVGFRIMWEKSSFDLAMVRVGSFAAGLGIPYVNYVFKF